MVSTLVPVMCVCGVCGVSRVVCGGVCGGKGEMEKERSGEGREIDNGGWVLDPVCCNEFHIGCQKCTAKPMGRILAK